MNNDAFNDLLLSYMEGILFEAELPAFRDELKASPEHLREYLSFLSLHAMLQCRAGFVQIAKPRASFPRAAWLAAAAGLALLLAGSAAWRLAPRVSAPQPPARAERAKSVAAEGGKPPEAPALAKAVIQPISSAAVAAAEPQQKEKTEMKARSITLAAVATTAAALAATQPARSQAKSAAAAYADSAGVSLDTCTVNHSDLGIQNLETRVCTYKDSAGRNLNTTKFKGLVVMLM